MSFGPRRHRPTTLRQVGLVTALFASACGVFGTELLDRSPPGTVQPSDTTPPATDPHPADTAVYDTSLWVDSPDTDTGAPAQNLTCADLGYPLPSQAPNPLAYINPLYYGVGVEGVVSGAGQFLDFDLGTSAYSATVSFGFYDSVTNYLCMVVGDASVTQTPNPLWYTSGQPWVQFEATMPNDLYTDCGMVDATIFGTTDLRDLVAGRSVWFAVGPLVQIRPQIQQAVETELSPAAWVSDWEPYVFALYTDLQHLGFGVESGYAFAYETNPCTQVVEVAGQPVKLTCPTQPGFEGLISARPYYIDTIYGLLP